MVQRTDAPERIYIDKIDVARAKERGVGSFYPSPSSGSPDDSIEYVRADLLPKKGREATDE